MKCSNCKKELPENANFCDSCGRAVSFVNEAYRIGDASLVGGGVKLYTFDKTRRMNWILLVLWVAGSIFTLTRTDFNGSYAWISIVLTFILMLIPALTIVLLSSSATTIFGIPLFMLESKRSFLTMLAIFLNSVLVLLGVGFIVLSVKNSQYAFLLSAAFFIIPAIINIVGLRKSN